MASTALLKTLRTLELFQSSDGALSVKDMAALSSESASSVQRSAYTLEALGYLEREDGGNRYVPGRSCLRPVYGYLRNNRFLEAATPYLIDLSERFKTRADLTVLDGTDIVYLSRIPSKDELLNLSPLGRRWPAASTASGRAILSALPEVECERLLNSAHFPQITTRTLVDRSEIENEIKSARILGYAYQDQEVLLGAASVGAAVVDNAKHVHGSIIIGGPSRIFNDPSQRQIFGEAVAQAAAAISGYLTT
ncbi:MAG: IclR family transcriptional regulator [Sulfitobacter sp.]